MELTDAGRAYFGAISPALAEIVRGTAAVFGRDERRRITIAAMPVCSPRFYSPTSSVRLSGRRRSETAAGASCLQTTTPSSAAS